MRFWDENPHATLTEEGFLAALQPRHKDCDCILCEMDKKCIEANRKVLFGEKQ